MSLSNIAFPKWEEVLSGLIEQYRRSLDLPDTLFEEAHILIKEVGRQKGKYTFTCSTINVPTADEAVPRELIEMLKDSKLLEQNQFYTLSLSDIDIKWVDERVTSVLGITKQEFSEEALSNWNHSAAFYHPMDALHVLRYAILKDYICQLKGLISPKQSYYFTLRFRMIKRSQQDDKSLDTKLIEKRRSFIPHTASADDSRRFYLNRWTVSNNAERHKVVEPSIEVFSDGERTRFLNTLMFLFNARYLGFSPKDILVVNYCNLYDGSEESRASLNRALRKHHDDRFDFEVKPFTDCLYYLNKKLTASLESHSLDEVYKSSFYVRLNRLGKAHRLGLTPLPRVLREIILTKAYIAS